MASKHLSVDLNVNGTILATKSTTLDVTLLTLLNINVDILSGTFATAIVELEYSKDGVENWVSFDTPKTFTGAQEEVGYDIDVVSVNFLRLILTTAEGGAGSVRFELTASDDVAYWIDSSIDMDDLDARGQVMDVTVYNTVRATLSDLSSTIGAGELRIEYSNDGIVWSSFSPNIQFDTADQTLLIDVRGVRFIRAKTAVVKGSALTGSLVAFATTVIMFGVAWIILSYASGWSTAFGGNSLAYRQVGDIVYIKGTVTKAIWSLPDTIHNGDLPLPLSLAQLNGICDASANVEAALIHINTEGDLIFHEKARDGGTGGFVWLDGLSYATN